MVILSSPLVLFSTVIFLSYTVSAEVDGSSEMLIYKKCRTEANLPNNASVDMDSYASSDVSKEQKCFVKCLFQNHELLTPEGSMDEHKTIELMKKYRKPEEQEKYAPIFRDCIAKVKKESDRCEYSFNILYCFIEGKKKI